MKNILFELFFLKSNKKLKLFCYPLICVSLSTINAQNNTITVKALPNGTEGNTVYNDSSPIYINPSGVASYLNSSAIDDWSVTSTTVTPSGAKNVTFNILMGGISTYSTSAGKDYGKKLTDGGIDRAGTGDLGIRSSAGNGILQNEGFNFGLDLSGVSTTASLQIKKIYVTWAGGTNDKGVIINRTNPSKYITFGNSAGVDVLITDNNENTIDISALNVYLVGGKINDAMIAVLNNSSVVSNFRITGIEFAVLTNILNPAVITGATNAHPRLLLKDGELVLINTLISQSPEFKDIHNYIIKSADEFLTASTIVLPTTGRFLPQAREAVKQIFYLSYAFRLTNNTVYAIKAESIINNLSNYTNWKVSGSQDLEIAEMCFAIAIGYDWLYNNLSTSTKINVSNAINRNAFVPTKSSSFWDSYSNWNQVCIGGLTMGALAIYGDVDTATVVNTEAKNVLNNILVKNPNSMNTYSNGNYAEGPMYWSYGTTYEVLMLSALEKIYGSNHVDIKRLVDSPGFLESAEFMQYVTGPSSMYFNFMDSTDKKAPLIAALWMAKKSNNLSVLSEEKKLLQNGGYLNPNLEDNIFLPLSLIYGKDVSLSNLSDPQKKLWVGYGDQPVAMVRTDFKGSNGKYFGVKAGTPNYSHGHMDGGSFVYDSQGVRWGLLFGKYDYGTVDAGLKLINPTFRSSDTSQNSPRWDVFPVSNLNNNTLSIKKTTETKWQRHKAVGVATIDEVYDTTAKRGAKVNLKDVIGLNNELNLANRSIYVVNDDYLEIKDEINNGSQSIDLYWNMATTAKAIQLSNSSIQLSQGGKNVILEIVSSNANVTFSIVTNRSTNPVDYFPTATYEPAYPGKIMVGFTSTIPANQNVTYTITIKDAAETAPSSVEPINNILLEIPNPVTGLAGNYLTHDESLFYIDGSGDVGNVGFYTNYAWNVYGSTDTSPAFNNYFKFTWEPMLTTNTTQGASYGALLTTSGIDRDSSGSIGVRNINNSSSLTTAIDPNEGFRLGFDAKQLPSTVKLKLLKVGVIYVNSTRTGVIVNRKDTTKKITFGGTSSTATVKIDNTGYVDVSSLNIKISGGNTDYDLASVFNTGQSGYFRINKFIFKIVTTTGKGIDETKNSEIIETDVLNVYPNPFKDYITLGGIDNINSETIKLKIYTLTGTCLLEKTVKKDELKNNPKIYLENLSNGVYLLNTTIGEKTIVRKIIKQ